MTYVKRVVEPKDDSHTGYRVRSVTSYRRPPAQGEATMTKLFRQVRDAVSVAMENSTTTTSGVQVIVTGTGAVRVDASDVLKYQSAKDQLAAVRKVIPKATPKK